MGHVHIAGYESYARDAVERAVRAGLAAMGGIEAFVKPGQRVAIKPNLLRSASPDAAVTTHPAVVEAVVRAVVAAGAEAVVVDSPGGPHNSMYLSGVYRRTGMVEAAERAGGACSRDMAVAQSPNLGTGVPKVLELLAPIANADVVINVCKLKTHGLTTMTGAIKNMFGAIPGTAKVGYHSRFPKVADFAQALLDIYMSCKTTLTIMDGVVGMEGNGPSAGTPRDVGLILAADDGIALDWVATELVGVDPLLVPTLVAAKERGLISGDRQGIELSGLGWDKAALIRPFQLPETITNPAPSRMGILVRLWPSDFLAAYPQANERCVGCGTCVRSCPVDAITIVEGQAKMDLDLCIRCYCCHELCPYDAIDLKRNWLARLVLGR